MLYYICNTKQGGIMKEKMTIKQLQEIIIKNFTNKAGVIQISGLIFHTSVNMSGMSVYGNLDQNNLDISGNFNQNNLDIYEDFNQNDLEVYGEFNQNDW
jgi:hypothetical protein